MSAKQQFINKWSNWWIFNKHKEMLNKAFESEQNEVIAVESHRVAELTAPALEGSGDGTPVSKSYKHTIMDTWNFAEWTAKYYVRLNDCWVGRYKDQRCEDNWEDTGALWAKWWENFRRSSSLPTAGEKGHGI